MGRLGTAIEATGVEARQGSRLLYDNSPCFISKELGTYPEECAIEHTRDESYRPMTQGRIERYQRVLENALLLQDRGPLMKPEERILPFLRRAGAS